MLGTIKGVNGILAVDPPAGRVFMRDSSISPVRIVDARTGQLLGRVAVQGRALNVWGVPLTAAIDAQSGVVLMLDAGTRDATGAVSQPGMVSVVDGRRGRILRTIRVGGGSSAITIDAKGHRAYVANMDDGTIRVLDLRRWDVSRVIALGGSPVALAIDDRTGHLVVALDKPIGRRPPDPWGWLPMGVRARLSFLPPPPTPDVHVPGGGVSVLRPDA